MNTRHFTNRRRTSRHTNPFNSRQNTDQASRTPVRPRSRPRIRHSISRINTRRGNRQHPHILNTRRPTRRHVANRHNKRTRGSNIRGFTNRLLRFHQQLRRIRHSATRQRTRHTRRGHRARHRRRTLRRRLTRHNTVTTPNNLNNRANKTRTRGARNPNRGNMRTNTSHSNTRLVNVQRIASRNTISRHRRQCKGVQRGRQHHRYPSLTINITITPINSRIKRTNSLKRQRYGNECRSRGTSHSYTIHQGSRIRKRKRKKK